MMRTGNLREALDELEAKVFDERTALLSDETRLRITPKGQKRVDQLVFSGDEIGSSYGTGGKVISVREYAVYSLPVFTIVYVELKAKPNKDGSYRETDFRWINECVAQDGKILKLFEANEDEVHVLKVAPHQSKLGWFV